ncbi:alpha/beta fold hydrolase [Gordonia pseudamarae]|uniref:Alpha/beta fold hydrolase n=1 Tax=Gordonia pseudamarae TaxID=2831662 RepID=A0ABX6ILA1_9ACTN|nr:alpha/beta fold hydrolase [Gordonia pseudamarae]QHN36663.1 alpha/beta fold hydrolase [Gordonia pseudamarae]
MNGGHGGGPAPTRRALWAAVTAVAVALIATWGPGGRGPALADPTPAAGATALPPDSFVGIPSGTNRFRNPRTAHPRPVILVHGTFLSAADLGYLAGRLSRAGFSVFTFNYGRDTGSVAGSLPGVYGTAPLTTSTRQLHTFVDLVRSRTGSTLVDLVGHSQGGLLIRRYLHECGGGAIRRVVTLAAPHHGTTLHGLTVLAEAQKLFPQPMRAIRDVETAVLGNAAMDQLAGSALLRDTDRGGETVDGVDYTAIITRHDLVVTPPESGFLTGSSVRNLAVQDRFPANRVGHLGMTHDSAVANLVIDALGSSASDRTDLRTAQKFP